MSEISKNQRANNKQIEKRLQAAHDIKAPFAVIKHYLRKENFLNDEVFHSAFERFELLLNELGGSRSTQETQNKQPLKRSIQEILLGVISEKQLLLSIDHRRNIKITENLINEETPIHSPGTDHDLSRILSNLIDNAIEAIPNSKDAVIHVELTNNQGAFNISIRDNGIGFPPEVISIAGKTPFSFNKVGGSGRGLYHARRVLRHLDGDLKVSNLPTGGAEVCISLPVLH